MGCCEAVNVAPKTRSLSAIELGWLLPLGGPPVAEAAPGLYVVRVSDAATSRALIARAEAAPWQPATINAELAVEPSVRFADVLDERAAVALTEECRERLFRATRGLASTLAPSSVPAEIQVVRYAAGGRYADHRDSPGDDATPRRLSVVWYLNDDFTGGETCFHEPDVCVEPLGGVAIVFLPLLLHRAEPVISGTKYAITAWYHAVPGRVR